MNNSYSIILLSTGPKEKALINVRSTPLGENNSGVAMYATPVKAGFLSMVEVMAAAKIAFEFMPVVESIGVFKGGIYLKQIYRGDLNEKK